MRRRSLRRNRRPSRLAVQQLEPRLALAVTPSLVTDINAVPRSGGPSETFVMGSFAYFSAEDATHGRELWKTNGTTAGTTLVKDIYQGVSPSYPYGFTVLGDKFFFVADDGIHGTELWVSDGSAAGTQLVKDLKAGANGSSPSTLTIFNGALYFKTYDYDSGSQFLWKTDGTEPGTQPIAGTPETIPGFNGFGVLGAELIFSSLDSGLTTTRLWKTNGTDPAVQFASREGVGGYTFRFAAGKAFFQLDNGSTGSELWVTNGTDAGTFLLKDINETTTEGSPYGSFPYGFTALGSEVFFVADDGVHGEELWKTDGTTGGTTLVKDIAPGTVLDSSPGGASPRSSSISDFNVINDKLVFRANDGTSGYELWESDGTTEGTQLLKDIAPDAASGSPESALTLFNGEYYFLANNSRELWKTDGTADGTVLVETFSDSDDDGSGSYGAMAVLGDELLFAPDDGVDGVELWKTDGSPDGAVLVKETIDGTSNAFGLSGAAAALDGKLYFVASDGRRGPELWKTDGTANGTSLVKEIVPGSNGSNPQNPITFNGAVYFSALNANFDRNLWKTDGTAGGTVVLKDVVNPRGFAAVDDSLYFIAEDSEYNTGIWKTNGTADGTTLATSLSMFSLNGEASLVALGSKLFFVGVQQGDSEAGLVYLDTTDLTTLYPLGVGGSASKLTSFNGSLYFAATIGETTGLYRLNNSAAVLAFGGTVGEVMVAGDSLYFAGDDGIAGSELYKIAAGSNTAVLVKDVYPGETAGTPNASSPSKFAAVGSLLYFVAEDVSGRAFWKTDGSAAGTVKVDVSGGDALLDGAPLGVVGSTLYFIGQDAANGREIWTASLAAPTPVNEAPTVTSSGTANAAENQTAVQTVTGSDPDAGTTLTYSISGGADAAKFSIDAGTGVLAFLTSPNFESPTDAGADNVYNVTVQVSDGSLTATKEVAVTVTNVNEAPSDIGLSASPVAENAAIGTDIGTLSTVDPDAGNSFTYTFASGAGSVDNAAFTIDGSVLKSAVAFNFEAKSSYSIRVKSTDQGGLFTEKQFTITVADVAEPLAIDRVSPPASRTYRAGEVLSFTVVLTRPVTVIGRPEIDLTVGRTRTKAVYQSGSGTAQLVFTYTVSSRDNDADGVALGNAIRLPRGASIRLDSTNLPLALPVVNTSGVLIDTTPPKVNAVSGPANGSYKAGQVLRFTAAVSEPVTVTGVPVIPLVVGSTARQATYVAGASSPTSLVFEYTVQAGETDANGIAAGRVIALPTGTSIVDGAGNATLLGIAPPNLARVLVDSAGPVATSITPPAARTYGSNAAIDFVVNFNEPVVVTGSPTLPVQVGSAARSAAFVGFAPRTGNRSLVFRAVTQTGDADADGVTVTGPLNLAGAVIADAAGNAAAGTLPGVNLSRVLVDAVGPTIVAVGEPDIDPRGTTLIVRIRFNEPVLVRGTPTIPFQIAGSPRQFVYSGGSNSSVLTFRYAIRRTDNFELEVTPGTAIVLGGGSTITDRLGNALASLDLPSDIIF
jgi:ELWxxDGT repeat protein